MSSGATTEIVRLTDVECDLLDGFVDRLAARERHRLAVERIITSRVAAARADERYRTLEAEADLIGNGTCCPECDGVAEMMRDRALVPRNPPAATEEADRG